MKSKLEDLIDIVLDRPFEFYEKICDAMSPEERIVLTKQLINRSCMSCTNGSCRVPYNEKIGIEEDGSAPGESCLGWSNPIIVGKSKVLSKRNVNELI